MDDKTLEYMGERVDRGRGLQSGVRQLDAMKNEIEKLGADCLQFRYYSKDDGRWIVPPVPNLSLLALAIEEIDMRRAGLADELAKL